MGKADPQIKVRVSDELKSWLDGQAERNGSSLNSEVVRAIRDRMERKEAR